MFDREGKAVSMQEGALVGLCMNTCVKDAASFKLLFLLLSWKVES